MNYATEALCRNIEATCDCYLKVNYSSHILYAHTALQRTLSKFDNVLDDHASITRRRPLRLFVLNII